MLKQRNIQAIITLIVGIIILIWPQILGISVGLYLILIGLLDLLDKKK